MREIKFRAWDEQNKKMRYGDPRDDEFYFENDGCAMQYSIWMSSNSDTNPPIMQYTGLLDKNGVRIFEGDVLLERYKEPDYDGREGILAEVVFHKGAFMIKEPGEDPEYTLGETYEDFEVVGNVFENKEMLEVE
ncbi:YopX protein [Andreesenia angusta]|uniref:YopX protein n=1 Tax=Andreesenia angusta TaxID=39480 RepID=A0A1S1V928_9FIRM|nr:YopX family protein [Andreesenia angusta]OHW63098.1 YopX protein [Andreesenia angusta]